MAEGVLYVESVPQGGGMQRKEVQGLHIDKNVPINNIHKALLDGIYKVTEVHGQEVVVDGQGWLLLWSGGLLLMSS